MTQPRWCVLAVACLAAGAGCARFGFELLEPELAGQIGAAGSGGAESGGAAGVDGSSAGVGGREGPSGGAAGSAGAAAPGSCSDGLQNRDEAGVDCGGADCAPCTSCTLSAPEVLGDPNYAGNDLWSPSISGDGLSLYFAVSVPGFPEQIALATRADRGAPFGTGQSLAPPVNEDISGTPRLSADGLSLYFFSERGGGAGSRDLYAATRRRSDEEFDSVQALSSLNGPDRDHLPWVSADERTIYFVSNRSGVADIFRSTRASVRDEFGPPEAMTELNSPEEDGGVSLTSDGLTVILSSSRPGGLGGRDLYLATRAIPGEPFSSPEPIAALNTTQNDFDPALSPDERELYFVSNRTGGDTWIYRSLRSCAR